MGEPQINIDPALLGEFIDESLDMLASLDASFVALEKEPASKALVETIFRPVHSIKGNAAFFGFMRIKDLAHELETLLDLLRQGKLTAEPGIVDLLLRGTDQLRVMLDGGRNGQEAVADPEALSALLNEVRAAASGGGGQNAWDSVFAALDQLMDTAAAADATAQTALQTLTEAVRSLAPKRNSSAAEAPTGDHGHVSAPAQALLVLLQRGVAAALPDTEAAEVRKLLTGLVNEAPEPTRPAFQEGLNACDAFLDSVGFDTLAAEVVLDHVKHAMQAWPADESPATNADEHAEDAQLKAAPANAAHHETRTMRVPESHIDAFLQHVGELLVVRDMFDHLRQRMTREEPVDELLAGFRRANETFATLAGELQRSIMSIRLVPVKNLLQKAPRMIRDIAQGQNKQIEVKIEGEALELDKSLTDLLDAPLTHMVRNAADHGIEPKDKRIAAGKPEAGTIRIAAEQVGEQVILSVEDDGKGLDYAALTRKAESLGLIAPGRTLSESETVDLLFRSGVSTAEAVTDISGRGVGMDVVKQAIEQAGGSIHVSSEEGKGSRFEVRLPKAVITQIMPGYVVQVAGQRYVLPLNRVREATALEHQEVETVVGRGRCVRRHDRVVPVLSVRQALGQPFEVAQAPTLVALESNRREVLAEVDEALGIQQVVLRHIEGIGDAGGLIRGGALMGDGTVALVLETDALDAA